MASHRRETNLHGIEDFRWPFSARFWIWAVAAAGLAPEHFVQRWERVMIFQLRSRTFLLTMWQLAVEGGNCRRPRAP